MEMLPCVGIKSAVLMKHTYGKQVRNMAENLIVMQSRR